MVVEVSCHRGGVRRFAFLTLGSCVVCHPRDTVLPSMFKVTSSNETRPVFYSDLEMAPLLFDVTICSRYREGRSCVARRRQ